MGDLETRRFYLKLPTIPANHMVKSSDDGPNMVNSQVKLRTQELTTVVFN